MKNYMKKIIVGIFTFVLLFTGAQSVFASGPFNGQSGDCNPGFGIGIYPNNIPRDSNGCWTSTYIEASAGETVNVAMYYRNNTGSPLTNVSGSIVKRSQGNNTYVFTGIMYSDQGTQTIGTATLKLTSTQDVVYSSTHYMRGETAVMSTTDTSVFHDDGGKLAIGTVPTGWTDYGEFLAVYKISNNAAPVDTCSVSLTASPTSINQGGNSLLTWNASGCTGTTIYPTLGNVNTSGSQNVSPTASTTYTLKGYNSSGVAKTDTVTITVNSTPISDCTASLSASNPSINLGGSSTLTWSTTNCTSATIYPTLGPVSINGDSQAVSPTSDTTYTLTAYGTNGSVVKKVTVNVVNVVSACTINNFNASPTSIISGSSSSLTWNTTGCNSVTISNLGYSVPTSGGPQSIWPTVTTTYVLSAYGNNGVVKTWPVTVYVNENNNNNTCRIINFDASDTSIEDGDSSLLTWTTENCTSVSIAGVASGLSRNSSYRVYPTSTRNYVLNAYGNNGSDSDSVRIYVDDNNNNYNNTCSINSFSANNTYVNVGGNTRLNWNTTNCTSVFISYLGNVNMTGSQTVYPVNNTNYIMTAYGGNGGTQTRSVYVTVNSYIPPVIPIIPINNCAVTTIATNITQTGAMLNGLVSGATGANTYFEYGTSVNLGYRTPARYSNGGTNFSDSVTGLAPNTIYFFRMASDCQGGLSHGSIEVFRTASYATNNNTVVKTVYVQQGTTVVGTASPIMLTITNRYQAIGAGDLVDYVVTYKNIGNVKLLHPMVQVVLPTNITLVNSSRGTYSVDTHTLSAQIEDLNAGQEGVIYLQGKVDSVPMNNSQIATTALLIYTSANGSQENAMAYVINTPRAVGTVLGDSTTTSTLGGAAFLGGFFSIGLLGWLIIILIILIIILVVRSASARNSNDGTHTPVH